MCPTYSNNDDTISIFYSINEQYFAMDAELSVLPAYQRDLIFDGNDQIELHNSFMTHVFSGSGEDRFFASNSDRIYLDSGSGNDYIHVFNSSFGVYSGDGSDIIYANDCRGASVVRSGLGDDRIYLNNMQNSIVFSGEGDDRIYLNYFIESVSVYLESGNDSISVGGVQNGIFFGGEGNDYFYSYERTGDLYFYGGVGSDTYQVDGNAIIQDENNSNDINTLIVNNAFGDIQTYHINRIITNNENGIDFSHVSVGGEDDVEYRGYTGNDTISGGAGDDLIWGLQGYDFLSGGAGSDTFAFSYLDGRGDRITDFSAAQGDRLGLTSSIFELPIGNLHPDRLVNIAGDPTNAASLGVAQLIYHINGAGSGNGNLYWDANGNAAGGLTWLGTINNTPLLTLSNFVVV